MKATNPQHRLNYITSLKRDANNYYFHFVVKKDSEVLGRLPVSTIDGVVAGMDARIGFFHANDGRKDSLIFDMMGFFRPPIIDRLVLNLLNKKMIQPENFAATSNDCQLNEEGRIIFCTRYEEYMAKIYREYGDKSPRDVIVERVKKFSEYINR